MDVSPCPHVPSRVSPWETKLAHTAALQAASHRASHRLVTASEKASSTEVRWKLATREFSTHHFQVLVFPLSSLFFSIIRGSIRAVCQERDPARTRRSRNRALKCGGSSLHK